MTFERDECLSLTNMKSNGINILVVRKLEMHENQKTSYGAESSRWLKDERVYLADLGWCRKSAR